MPTTKRKQKTPAEMRAERLAELDYFAQVEQQRVERRATQQAETNAFLQRVEKYHEQRAAALERGEEMPTPVIPTLDGIMTEKREAERLEQARLEAERIAAIPARDILISALPAHKKEAIAKWESTNKGQQFPLEAIAYL